MSVKDIQTCSCESRSSAKPVGIAFTPELQDHQQGEQDPGGEMNQPEDSFDSIHRTKVFYPAILELPTRPFVFFNL